jgi:predicted nucleotidyltransferase
MDRAAAIAALKCHEDELKELGIIHAGLFGSTAREEARETSDVDIAVTLTPGPRGFAHLERMDRIKARLSAIIGAPVDVIEEPAESRRVQQAIDRDRVLAF